MDNKTDNKLNNAIFQKLQQTGSERELVFTDKKKKQTHSTVLTN